MPDNRIYVTPVMASCESFLPRKDMTMNLRPTAYFGARDQRFRGNVITCFGRMLIAGFGGT